jgi:arginase family enzyme
MSKVEKPIVEYNPDWDHLSIAATVAAKFVKEIAARMIASS